MNPKKIKESSQSLILSASGWRKIFAANGNEESLAPDLTQEDRIISAAMAKVFSGLVKKKQTSSNAETVIALGIDSRPTGPAMAAAMIPVFLAEGIQVRYTGICAAPEIMAWTGSDHSINGFCYISASHNPVGHNGVKFGLGGGVIGGRTASDLIDDFRRLLADRQALVELEQHMGGETLSPPTEAVLEEMRINKKAAYHSYARFTRICVSKTEKNTDQQLFYSMLRDKIAARPLGVVAELNGSARSLSIDKEYLSNLGVKVRFLNDTPGKFVHRIVPEGHSLNLCREELEKAHRADPSFVLGYVPDCDGDRGNMVYFNEKKGRAEILEAQEVFALSVLSELTALIFKGEEISGAAVAVNGPTSMRIDRIASFLGAEVYHAEVGEANVVNLAENLRERGKIVPILGEGSNGGNITYPAQVRDPLNTLTALMNLLLVTSSPRGTGKKGLFQIWCNASGQPEKYKEDFTLADIMATLPRFTTTSAFEKKALATIKTLSHGRLKAEYESIFPARWEAKKEILKNRWAIVDWEERNTEGQEERIGVGAAYRSGQEKGGFKILFKNDLGEYTDYIWMRGSGTEPVFRVLADCRGEDPEREAWFLNWHKEIIAEADALSLGELEH